MKQVEEGEYKVLPEQKSNDEIGSLVTSYNHMVTKIKTLIEEVYVAEIKQKNAKFLALQTQINPHMLYNTYLMSFPKLILTIILGIDIIKPEIANG